MLFLPQRPDNIYYKVYRDNDNIKEPAGWSYLKEGITIAKPYLTNIYLYSHHCSVNTFGGLKIEVYDSSKINELDTALINGNAEELISELPESVLKDDMLAKSGNAENSGILLTTNSTISDETLSYTLINKNKSIYYGKFIVAQYKSTDSGEELIALDINYQPCYQEQIISNTINNISDNTNLIRVMYWENDIGKLKPITKCCEIK